ncbi:MAG: hypothetical protein EA419_08900 [Wenzhouxiangella sp.]|nr:MAG: hypothetical protein EA419_08900 [Wenzhouxiangella sp.]
MDHGDGQRGRVLAGARAGHRELVAEIDSADGIVAGRIPKRPRSNRTTLEAQKSGADGALIVTPYYNKPSQTGLPDHRHEKTAPCNRDGRFGPASLRMP